MILLLFITLQCAEAGPEAISDDDNEITSQSPITCLPRDRLWSSALSVGVRLWMASSGGALTRVRLQRRANCHGRWTRKGGCWKRRYKKEMTMDMERWSRRRERGKGDREVRWDLYEERGRTVNENDDQLHSLRTDLIYNVTLMTQL